MPKDGLTKRPWYRWCPRDFYADATVVGMTKDQRMRYRESLDMSWMSDTPGVATEEQWRKWLGYQEDEWRREARGVFESAFVAGEQWVQKRLETEHTYVLERSQKATHALLKRYSRSTDVVRQYTDVDKMLDVRCKTLEEEESKKEDSCSPVGEPPPVVSSKKHDREWKESFVLFWEDYPRKVGKGAAEAAWKKLGSSAPAKARGQGFFNSIMDGLDSWKSLHGSSDPEFIPHASTWLSQRRWEDQGK